MKPPDQHEVLRQFRRAASRHSGAHSRVCPQPPQQHSSTAGAGAQAAAARAKGEMCSGAAQHNPQLDMAGPRCQLLLVDLVAPRGWPRSAVTFCQDNILRWPC